MELRINQTFIDKVIQQIDYIALDKPIAALNFYNDLFERIERIPEHPFKHRQSIYADSLFVRDLIFKGYTITFKIIEEEQIIEVFGFSKHENV
jgi:plasmid stabilization system protein ParE